MRWLWPGIVFCILALCLNLASIDKLTGVKCGIAVLTTLIAVGAMYADGHILYGTNGTLTVQPFDADSLKLTGPPRQIAAGDFSHRAQR